MKEFFLKFIKKIDVLYTLLICLTLIACYFFVGHSKIISYDWGREFYFPIMMNDGKVLYKDILNLFGPGAYLLNAAVYKFFGSGLKIHYILGYICSLVIISFIYFTSNLFNDKFKSFIISLFSIITAVGTLNWANANYHFPYTYSIIYGLISWYLSIFFLIKSNILGEKKYKYALISALFAGFGASTKYEFAIFGALFLVLIIIAYIKDIKKLSLLFSSFIVLPLLQTLFLIKQGVTFDCFKDALNIMKDLINTASYRLFYSMKGALFDLNIYKITLTDFLYAIVSIMILTIPFIIIKRINKAAGYITIIPCICAAYFIVQKMPVAIIENDAYLTFLPTALLILFIVNIKRINKNTLIFCISTFAVSLKVFWSAQIHSYGNYFLPIICIAIFACIKSKKIKSAFVLYLILVMVIIAKQNITEFEEYSYPVKARGAVIYTEEGTADKTNKLIDYINNNIDKGKTITLFPEWLTVNYLTERKSDYYLYSLQPPYVELFGIDKYISEYGNNMPDYFVLHVTDTIAYGADYYCDSYAQQFCDLIQKEYTKEKVIRDKFRTDDYNSFIIYKKRGE